MKKLWIVVFTLVLLGCGGGGGYLTPKVLIPPSAYVVIPDPSGTWKGTIFYGDGSNDDIGGLIISDGRGRFTSSRGDMFVINSLSTNANTIEFGFTAFSALDTFFESGLAVVGGTFTGTFTERKFFDGDFVFDIGESARLDMYYDYGPDYEGGASLNRIAGLWVDGFGSVMTVYAETASTGTAFMQAANGCVTSGNITTIDRFNIYDIVFLIELCGRYDGVYSGLGILDVLQYDSRGTFVVRLDNGLLPYAPLFHRP